MAGADFLIYDKRQESIGVRVVTWREPGAPSFPEQRLKTRKKLYGGDSLREQLTGQGASRVTMVDQIILHHDGMRSSAGCFRVLVDRGLSTHLMIDRDGTVYQPLDLALVAYHAAGRNLPSVGIDLNNPVRPDRVKAGERANRQTFRGRINGSNVASLGYTDAQYDSLIAVLRGLGRIFSKLQNLTAPVGDDGKVRRTVLVNKGFVGLVGHLHVSATKWDPGPGFDWERVLIGVRGTRLFYPFTLEDAPNLDRVAKAKALQNAEAYFRENESGKEGFFPVGVNQGWHTGVHFPMKPGTPIYAPADGTIVAARASDDVKGMGSPNMVVIRHELPIGDQKQTLFSVLSHLQKPALGPEATIDWVRRFYEDPDGPTGLDDDVVSRYPPASRGHVALLNDRVALADVEVKAGELIGFSGTFNSDPSGRGEPKGVLDFAIIAEKPLFPKADLTFEPVDDDDDDDILCNSRKVWKRFTDDPEALRGLVDGGYPMSPEEIREVYRQTQNGRALRWVAARHVTEYSTKTKFGGLFGGGVDFEWYVEGKARQYVDRIRKFLWWDDKVTEHAELPDDGLVWSYHPIALATWLAVVEGRRAVEKGGAVTKAIEDEDALRRQKRADAALEARFVEQAGANSDHNDLRFTEDIVGGQDMYEQEAEDPSTKGWLRWEQGEWEPERD